MAPLTARERLIALVPRLSEEDCGSLVHEVRTWLRARRLRREQAELELPVPYA